MIRPDLTQRRQRPQHSGVRIEIKRKLAPPRPAGHRLHTDAKTLFLADTQPNTRFAFVTMGEPYKTLGGSEGSEAMCRQQPKHHPQELSMTPKAQRLGGKRRIKPYLPVNGNQAGPLFWIECRETGVRMASCRGVIHHVMGEAKKFAEAQGLTLADVFVRIEDHENV